jgi:hypothetical protein
MKINRLSLTIIIVLMMVPILSYSSLAGEKTENASLLWLNPPGSIVHIGDALNIIIQLDDVTNVYGAEMELGFDPAILAVVDADINQGGVQITEGVCPAPDFVLINTADNSAGTIGYVVTQLSPTPPCAGGEVATIEFQCLSEGTSPVSFSHSLISDPDGMVIGAPTQGATVACSNNPPLPPSNPTPADTATDVSILTNLSWEGGDPDPGDTVSYDVFFDTASPPTALLCDDTISTTCDPGTLSYNSTYYWQVIATDNHGASTPGGEWSFTTEQEPSYVYLPTVMK